MSEEGEFREGRQFSGDVIPQTLTSKAVIFSKGTDLCSLEIYFNYERPLIMRVGNPTKIPFLN